MTPEQEILSAIWDNNHERALEEFKKFRDTNGIEGDEKLRKLAKDSWVPDLLEELISEFEGTEPKSGHTVTIGLAQSTEGMINSLYEMHPQGWYPQTNIFLYYLRNHKEHMDLLWARAVSEEVEDDLLNYLENWYKDYTVPDLKCSDYSVAEDIFRGIEMGKITDALDTLRIYDKLRGMQEELPLLHIAKHYGYNQKFISSLRGKIKKRSQVKMEKRIKVICRVDGVEIPNSTACPLNKLS